MKNNRSKLTGFIFNRFIIKITIIILIFVSAFLLQKKIRACDPPGGEEGREAFLNAAWDMIGATSDCSWTVYWTNHNAGFTSYSYMTAYNILINQSWYYDIDPWGVLSGDLFVCENGQGGHHVVIIDWFDWQTGDAGVIYGGGGSGHVIYDELNLYNEPFGGDNEHFKGHAY